MCLRNPPRMKTAEELKIHGVLELVDGFALTFYDETKRKSEASNEASALPMDH